MNEKLSDARARAALKLAEQHTADELAAMLSEKLSKGDIALILATEEEKQGKSKRALGDKLCK